MRDASAVDEDIDRTEVVAHSAKGIVHLALLRDVALSRDRIVSGALDRRHRLARRRLGEVEHRDTRAGTREANGDRSPDARSSPGDESGSLIQSLRRCRHSR